MSSYIVEMLNITKEFPGIKANDNIILQLKQGEIHALLGENGAGKSTLMSVLFGLYQPEEGVIKKDGKVVRIKDPNDANALHIGMVHQHFKLVEVFTVLDNIILGVEPTKAGFLQKQAARQKLVALSERYGLRVDPDAKIEDISVGMQQRAEILKMLYRDNEILIFDEPTAVLTPQEIEELMSIMRAFAKEGKSILFITHKLNEIMAVADRCTVLRKGKCVGTVEISKTSKQELSHMMVGREVSFQVAKAAREPGETILTVEHMTVPSKLHKNNSVKDVSFTVREGEIVCLAGIEGNGQTEFVHALTGLERMSEGKVQLLGRDITQAPIRARSKLGMSHIPEDRHKHGLILDYTLEENLVLQRYWQPQFQRRGFIRKGAVRQYALRLIDQYDIRSGQGPVTTVRSMSGGNQQKAIVAREIDRDPSLLVAVQPTRGLDVGAIEYIHKQIVAQRDAGKAVLLVSLELDEVMNVSDRILVMYEGEIVGELDPKQTTVQELGLYMAGAKRQDKTDKKERSAHEKIDRAPGTDIRKASTSVIASLISILCGLVVGLIVLFFFNADFAWSGFKQLVSAGVSTPAKFAKVLYQAAPLIMTGLSVGFAFKTGLFNIGATGQYTVGAFCALLCAMPLQLPWYLCLIAAMIGGAIWGIFPGLFKALFNVNEVITSIMFNWIGLFLVNFSINNIPMMLATYWGASNPDRTGALGAANPAAIIPKLGLDKLLDSNYMNISIFIAIILAVLLWIILSKTTFGYELKACGYNRNASVYAGVNAKRNIVFSMMIAGSLAGIGGGMYYLAGPGQYTLVKALLPAGFNGIPVALLASSHPLGTIFSGLFVSYIQVGGEAMQPEFVKEIIDIIVAVIIYLSAFALLMRELIGRIFKKRGPGKTADAPQPLANGNGAVESEVLEA